MLYIELDYNADYRDDDDDGFDSYALLLANSKKETSNW